MSETPPATNTAAAIPALAAMPAPPIACFVIGPNDLAAEIGAPQRPGRPALLPHIAHALLAARAHGLAVLDGTWNDLDDRKGLQGECRQGREMGFDGKTLVHPTQVTIANDVYAPDPEELAWSRKVVDAFAVPGNSALEVLQLSGRMVERLHERSARRMIALADAIAALDTEMAALAGATARRRLTPAARSGS
jgi:citrate lyase subunit beta/citryl-CoA lyase